MNAIAHPRAGAGIVWSLVEDGFHVGSRGGDFLGYIERQRNGRFVAVNTYSQHIGEFADLPAAMKALSSDLPVVPPHLPAGRSAGRR